MTRVVMLHKNKIEGTPILKLAMVKKIMDQKIPQKIPESRDL